MARKAKPQETDAEGVTQEPEIVSGAGRFRQVRTETLERVPVQDPPDEQDDPDEYEEPLTPLDSLIAEFGDDDSNYSLAVFKQDRTKPNGKQFMGPLEISGLSNGVAMYTRLQSEYGGGEFIVQLNYKGRYRQRIMVSVATPPAERKAPDAAPQADALAAVLREIQESNRAMLAAITAPKPSAFAQIMSHPTVAALAPILAQQLGSRLFAQPATPTGDLLTQLQSLSKVKDTMDALGMTDAEPSTASTLMKMFDSFGKPLLEKLATAQALAPAPQPAPVAMVPAAGAVPAMPQPQRPNVVTIPRPPSATGPVTMPAEIPEGLRVFVPVIIQNANAGTVPEVFAEKILEAVPDESLIELKEAIDSGKLLAALRQIPSLKNSGPWLDAVARAVSSGIVVEDEPEGGNDVSVGAGGGDASAESP